MAKCREVPLLWCTGEWIILPALRLFTTPEGIPLEILYGACPEQREIASLAMTRGEGFRMTLETLKKASPLFLLECQKA